MYQKGDLVVYANMGVCRVLDAAVPDFCAPGEERTYYILEPRGESGRVYVPTDANVYMRPAMTREEANRLIDRIPTVQAEPCHSTVLQELNAHYSEALKSHSCEELIGLLMSIYAKKQYRARHNQKMGALDESYRKRGEALLYGELSAALDIPEEQVPEYIKNRIKGK